MNERIKELAEQANGPNPFYGTLKNQMTLLGDDAVERFAELIVLDCVQVIEKEVSMKYKDGGETEEFMGGHYAGSLLARVKIKQHFGVEE